MKGHNPRSNANDSNDKPQRVSVSGKVSVEYDPAGINNIANAIRSESARNEGAANQIEEAENRQADEQRRSNTIAILATGISAAMFIATLLVFFQSKDAIKAANKSASVAENTFKEVKKEFEIDNEPYIEANSIGTNIFKIGDPIVFHYKISNLSKYPLRIIEFKEGVIIKVNEPDINELKKIGVNNMNKLNKYLIKENPVDFIFPSPFVLNKSTYDTLMAANRYVYLSAYFIYKNLVTNVEKEYDMTIRVSNVTEKAYRFDYITNENDTLKR